MVSCFFKKSICIHLLFKLADKINNQFKLKCCEKKLENLTKVNSILLNTNYKPVTFALP